MPGVVPHLLPPAHQRRPLPSSCLQEVAGSRPGRPAGRRPGSGPASPRAAWNPALQGGRLAEVAAEPEAADPRVVRRPAPGPRPRSRPCCRRPRRSFRRPGRGRGDGRDLGVQGRQALPLVVHRDDERQGGFSHSRPRRQPPLRGGRGGWRTGRSQYRIPAMTISASSPAAGTRRPGWPPARRRRPRARFSRACSSTASRNCRRQVAAPDPGRHEEGDEPEHVGDAVDRHQVPVLVGRHGGVRLQAHQGRASGTRRGPATRGRRTPGRTRPCAA